LIDPPAIADAALIPWRRVYDGLVIAVRRGLSLAACLLALGLVAGSPLARANDLFTLDAHPETPGNVIVDAAGNAYVGWTHEAGGVLVNVPMFCKIPAGGTCTKPTPLAIPGASGDEDDVSGVFPVFGAGSTVYVVAPRYVKDDVVIWTSTDGGESFGAGTLNANGYPGLSDPTDVLLHGSELLIGAHNPGLGFGTTPAAGGSGAHFSFESPGAGGVAGSSLGLDASGNPVEAYWNLSSTYEVLFYRYAGAGSLTEETKWVGPSLVTKGYESHLSGGTSGLFLVSQDYPASGTEPTVLEVRKYAGTSFGAPTVLSNDASVDLFDGGAIAQAPSGLLAVAWPGTRGTDQARVMRLFTSSNGGASFTESDIAHLGSGYADMENASLAIADTARGWLTYSDAAGLQVADLNPIAPTPAPAVPIAKKTPKPYNGPTRTVSKTVGANLLTLTVPKSCLSSAQPFYVGVGKKARHKVAKSLRARMKVVKVTFSFDGKKLKTLKKKPFRYLIVPGPLVAGSKHTVSARVSAIVDKHGKKKRVVRTLKGQISIC
jgi:hypothetical protein